MAGAGIGHQKAGKMSFDEIYDHEDPRPYYNKLGTLDYATPGYGQGLFHALLEEKTDGREEASVLDVCCSYGVNAALLKCEMTMGDLYGRYGSEEVADLSGEELVESDTAFYAEREKEGAPRVVGIDPAANAVSYGVRAGLLDEGFDQNLESEEPCRELERAVAGTDMMTVTGGIGYISERTFDRLLGCMEGKTPWVAAFALRWVSYEKISDVLSKYGLVTEKLEGHTFPQRRFASRKEHEYVIGELEKMGIDPEGKESEGTYHAEFYVSRTPEHAARVSLEDLVGPALEGRNGRSRG